MGHRGGVLVGGVAAAPAQVVDGQAQARKALGDAGDTAERVGGQQAMGTRRPSRRPQPIQGAVGGPASIGSSSSKKRSPSMPGWSRQVAMAAAAAEFLQG